MQAGQLVRAGSELGVAWLDIEQAYGHHSGVYTVRIANDVGDAATSATVKVCLCMVHDDTNLEILLWMMKYAVLGKHF